MERFAPALLAGLAAVAFATLACGADAERGRQLYETRCTECHATSVHGRVKRTVASCGELREQVERWGRQQGPAWTGDEVDDVALWLNERYYHFPVENGRCAAPLAALQPAGGG
jgi:cytochrome c